MTARTAEQGGGWWIGVALVIAALAVPVLGNILIDENRRNHTPISPINTIFGPKTSPRWPEANSRTIDGSQLSKVTWKKKRSRKATCTIITDPELFIFAHELAHCNGWDHKMEETYPASPLDDRYYHAFNGKLIIIVAENGDPTVIRRYAQKNAIIKTSPKTVAALCTESTKGSYKYPANTGGCAPVLQPVGKTRPGVIHQEVSIRLDRE